MAAEGRLPKWVKLARQPGMKWLAQRLLYAFHVRVGVLQRRMPCRSWDRRPLRDFLSNTRLAEPECYVDYRRSSAPPFFFAPGDRGRLSRCLVERGMKPESAIVRSANLAGGKLRFFHHLDLETGFPPHWHRNPLTGVELPADLHWSAIDDFGSGDIKFVWEPSRFTFAYDLVRAYWHTGDEQLPELFWRAVEDWRLHNPPQSGPNWKCGQEIAFRLMAWCFGLYGFLDSSSSTGRRVADLAQMIAVSAERIEGNIGYALSQRNNHGISEATGLFTAGVLFPEFENSSRWFELGRSLLERLGSELIYEDGSFVQHSFNYHRVMLHDVIWSMRLGELCGRPFGEDLTRRVERAAMFLHQHLDPVSGRVPNYGANDGALVLPINECDYLDYRPVVQAGVYLTRGYRILDDGPWDEDLAWLFGPEALTSPPSPKARTSLAAYAGGYFTLVGSHSWAMIRCHTYRHRPSQADMLHLDLWHRGENVLRDGGSYSYNCPAPFDRYFVSTRAHNTVEVDGRDQMVRASRFLWLDWTKAEVLQNIVLPEEDVHCWVGEHYGYRKGSAGAIHRRGVLRVGDGWVIVDDLFSKAEHEYVLRWRVAEGSWEEGQTGEWRDSSSGVRVRLTASHVFRLEWFTGSRNPEEGWESLYYGEKTAVPTIVCRVRGSKVRCITLVSCGEAMEYSERDGVLSIRGRPFVVKPLSSPSVVMFDVESLVQADPTRSDDRSSRHPGGFQAEIQ